MQRVALLVHAVVVRADTGQTRRTQHQQVVEALAPGSDWQELVEWTIRQDASSVAWVGHAPCVSRLVAISIGDGSAAVRMQKGAIAAIALDDGPGQPGELEWLATPDFVGRG